MNLNFRLNFPATFNARELGGYATANGQQTRMKSFVRSDNLRRLTPEGVQAVLDYGVRTVIDLRWPFELEMDPNPFATHAGPAQYAHLSLLGDSQQAWHERVRSEDDARGYLSMLDYFQPEMKRVMQTMAHAPEGGVLFHCHAGKDRTGVVAMLLLSLAEVPDAIIANDYFLTEANIKPAYAVALSDDADPKERTRLQEDLRCPPEIAMKTLGHVRQQYGGTAAYLHEIGLHTDEIALLRTRLIQT
jgi:protein-tyrosine phosphatase